MLSPKSPEIISSQEKPKPCPENPGPQRLSTWDMEAERAEIQSHPQLRTELKASLNYLRPCLKRKLILSGRIHWRVENALARMLREPAALTTNLGLV